MTEPHTQRLFVALWPQSEIRNRLVEIQTEFRLSELGRIVPPSKFHITLQFLGEVADAEIETKREFVRNLQFSPFSIQFDLVGSWPRNEVSWVGSSTPSPQLNDLVADIRAGLPVKKTRKFIPHITLARKVRKKLHAPIKPFRWEVNRVDLVRSILDSQGAIYETIEHSAH